MDPVQFLKCILFFSLDRIIIYGNKLYDLRKLVGLPVWFVGNRFIYATITLSLLKLLLLLLLHIIATCLKT